ncbi:hypothetical protein [Agaribacter flavus]|uniref:Uncharacterized protein n=1 Tax=Agaribacter flavus TaxID=1902781 RepID=A0ABV7FQ46_9ALTE
MKSITLFCFILLLFSCENRLDSTETQAQQSRTSSAIENLPDKNSNDILSLKGTIQYQHFEGGFYGFVDSKGNKYTPMNLQEAYRRDGIRVRIQARELTQIATTTQFGIPIEVLAIEEIESKSKRQPVSRDL